MKQYTFEVPFSSTVHHRKVVTVLASGDESAVSKAIHQIRSLQAYSNVVVGDPLLLEKESIEEIYMPAGAVS